MENLKLVIDQESVNIYIDNGDEEEPTQIAYWHLDEVEEDANVAISIANTIDLYHRNPEELLSSLGFKINFVEVEDNDMHKQPSDFDYGMGETHDNY